MRVIAMMLCGVWLAAALSSLTACSVSDPRTEEWVKQITARVNEHETRIETLENALKLKELGRFTLIPHAKGE